MVLVGEQGAEILFSFSIISKIAGRPIIFSSIRIAVYRIFEHEA